MTHIEYKLINSVGPLQELEQRINDYTLKGWSVQQLAQSSIAYATYYTVVLVRHVLNVVPSP